MINIHIGFYPKSNVDRLYLTRRKDGRVQDTVKTAILGFRNYVRKSLLIAARTTEDDKDREKPIEYKKRKKNKRKIQPT